MDCPECGSFNSRLVRKCAECGAVLEECGESSHVDDAHDFGDASVHDSAPRRTRSAPRITTGQRIAGALLVANAVTVFWMRGAYPVFLKALEPWLLPGAVVDLVLGLALLKGFPKWPVRLAILRASVALTVALTTRAASLGAVAAGAAFATSMLLLLVRRASTARIALACVLYAGLVVAGVAVQRGVITPSGHMIVMNDLLSTDGRLRGRAMKYDLSVDERSYRLVRQPAIHRSDPTADLMAVDVEEGVVLSTYVEQRPRWNLSIGEYSDGLPSRLTSSPDVVEDLGTLAAYPLRSHVLRLSWMETETKIRWKSLRALVVGVGWGLQVSARVPERDFGRLEPSLRKLMDSLRIDAAELRPPEGMDPLDGRTIAGPEWPFTLELRGSGWHRMSGPALHDLSVEIDAKTLKDSWYFRQLYAGAFVRIASWENGDEPLTAKGIVDHFATAMSQKGVNNAEVRFSPDPEDPTRRTLASFEATADSTRWHVIVVARVGKTRSLVGIFMSPATNRPAFDEWKSQMETLDFPP